MIDTLPIADALAREVQMLGEVAEDPTKRHLWLWQSPQGLVAPRKMATLPGFAAAQAEMAARGWPVHLRATGGDVTPQGPGIVNVTHVYACPAGPQFDLDAEYGRLCTPIEAALGEGASRGWQPGAFCDGAYNVQYRGKKFAGTAMRFRPTRPDRTRFAILAHALMLFKPPTAEAIDALNRFLELVAEPRRIDPAAHTGLPANITDAAFMARLTYAFS